ncbi:MAG: TRAP transporter substrate-binding protein [Proteobacteria bacterium]|nr:TRAP transporter substrate-binding protein [Burkholderiales bacterium]
MSSNPVVKNAPKRRKFLTGAAAGVAGAATLAFPAIVRGQNAPISLRFQSTWPTKDIFHEYALDFAKRVNDMSAGRLRIEVLPAGAVVKAFDLIDAVNKGVLDGGHGVSGYWYGKNSAYSLFGTGPSFGMDANMLLGWIHYGGGREFYSELQRKVMGFDVEGFLYGPMPTQPLGWFKKVIKGPEDFKGLKFRTIGLSIDVFKEMGASVVALPGGDIVAGLDRGLIDAAEFNNASSDRILGFPDVSKICMLQSYHQPLECFEILFSKKRYDSLPADLREIIGNAATASSADMSWKAMSRYSQDYIEMRTKQNVRFFRTPRSILQAQLNAWDRVVEAKSKENPLFAKILESQRAWAERVVNWSNDTVVPNDVAFAHYFARKAAPAGAAPAKKA